MDPKRDVFVIRTDVWQWSS